MSAWSQSPGFRPREIIVVDDHSDDATGAVAAELGARVIRLDRNQGAATARNTASAAATQPWLALLDADDEWLPNHLSTLWPIRADHVLVSGACASYYDDDPLRPPEYAGTVRPRSQIVSTPAALIPLNFVMASATIVRKDAVLSVGGYRTHLRYAEDWDLWLRVLERGTALVTSEVVTVYHRHGRQKSQHASGPSQTHDTIVLGCANRPWWSSAVEQRWIGLKLWGDLEDAMRQRRWRRAARLAAQIARQPDRLRAVALRQVRYRLWQCHSARLRRSLRRPDSVLGAALATRRRNRSK